jgi:hypothetical protein
VTLVEKLKLEKKGATKPPKTAELHHTLTGITPKPVLYVKVTGTGITAVGRACQLQFSSATATQPIIPAAGFISDGLAEANGYFFPFGAGFILNFGGGGGCFRAPVSLPEGATVTSYDVVLNDNGNNDSSWYLDRVDLTTGADDNMATLTSSGSTTSIQDPSSGITPGTEVVDTSHMYYAAGCIQPGELFYAARVSYTQ